MDLLQLTYFCDAAESENFSRTAEKFMVPTSNISQVIRRLESDVGAPLFDRKANRVSLNAKGRLFYRRARVALNSLSEAKRLLADGEDEIGGELRIFVGCNRATVAKAIERFRAEYPGVFFSLDHHRMTDPSSYDLIISDYVDGGEYERRLLVRERVLWRSAILIRLPNAGGWILPSCRKRALLPCMRTVAFPSCFTACAARRALNRGWSFGATTLPICGGTWKWDWAPPSFPRIPGRGCFRAAWCAWRQGSPSCGIPTCFCAPIAICPAERVCLPSAWSRRLTGGDL